jgi:hypothetical protein
VDDSHEIEKHLTLLLGEPIATEPAISLFKIEASPRASQTLYALGQTPGWGRLRSGMVNRHDG